MNRGIKLVRFFEMLDEFWSILKRQPGCIVLNRDIKQSILGRYAAKFQQPTVFQLIDVRKNGKRRYQVKVAVLEWQMRQIKVQNKLDVR